MSYNVNPADPYRTPVPNPIAAGIGRGVPGQTVVKRIGGNPLPSIAPGDGTPQMPAPPRPLINVTTPLPYADRGSSNSPAATGMDPDTQLGMENRGQIARGASPGYAPSQGVPMIGTAARPTLAPGEVNPATGLTSQQAHDRNQVFQPNPQSIQMTEQIARPIWQQFVKQNGENYGTAANQFYDYMQQNHGVDGSQLLNKWQGDGTLLKFDFAQPGQTTPAIAKPTMTLSEGQQALGTSITPGAQGQRPLLATLPNGQSVMVDANGQRVGGVVTTGAPLSPLPVMGPQPGYTPLARDETPFFQPQQHALATPSIAPGNGATTQPSVTPNNSSTPSIATAGASPVASAAPSIAPGVNPANLRQAGETWRDVQNYQNRNADRQQIIQNQGDIGKAIASVPIAEAQTRADAGVAQAQIKADGGVQQAAVKGGRVTGGVTANIRPADRVSALKVLATERVPDGNGGTRKLNLSEKLDALNRIFGGTPAATTQPTQPSTFAGGDGAAPITQQNAAPSTQPALPDDSPLMVKPDGSTVRVHPEDVQKAIKAGYRRAR